jgi:6-pyruvoyltetrahydropterin/6-carboxytetrahydropterin synthase
MHKLAREVRFSINPFSAHAEDGFNSYASKPTGEGLSFYFGLWVEVSGLADPATGFVVNVSDIDRAVRKYSVPILGRIIKESSTNRRGLLLGDMVGFLKKSWGELQDKFTPAHLSRLCLELNPFRKVAVDSEDCKVVYFSEKFEFAAGHKLWNEEFSDERNLELFGKCANPAGHGHNYIIEVTVKGPLEQKGHSTGEFEKIVEETFIKLVDHKNLNLDVPGFENINPTVENITAFAWSKLVGQFGQRQLHCVTIWETDRTYCTFYGP